MTAAHEYFHAVQFAYDFFEDGWFMEATATWAEDELFDTVNDNVNYLPIGQLGRPIPGRKAGPSFALDGFWDGNYYGNWIFFRYLTERLRASRAGMPVLVRDMWTRAGQARRLRHPRGRAVAPRQAAATSPAATPSSPTRTSARARRTSRVGRRGTPPRRPGPTAPSAPRSSRRVHPGPHDQRLRAAAAGGEPARGQPLTINVNMPAVSQGSVAIVTVVRRSGSASTARIALNAATGDGSRAVAFDPDTISYVNLTLVNASTRFRNCGSGNFIYSCSGTPALRQPILVVGRPSEWADA